MYQNVMSNKLASLPFILAIVESEFTPVFRRKEEISA